uniref:Uncharacterized protein n=1 Tax=Cacopsylla melanoneura TaxID=428564 RepID=A0A8D8QTB9_9HEMI
MRIPCIVNRELVPRTASGVQITVVFRPPGIVMVMTIVPTALMNPPSIVRVRGALVSVTCSRVTMATVYRGFTFVTATTTVWTTRTRMPGTNAITANVTTRPSSRVPRTRLGTGPNVYRRNGCVTETPTVWTVLTRTRPH